MSHLSTVVDIFRNFNDYSSIVMVVRHGNYFMEPLIARLLREGVSEDEVEAIAYARNLARKEPDCMFALNGSGIAESRRQGMLLAREGIRIDEVIGSHQGRGPDTGLFIAEGFHDIEGEWLPFSCNKAIDYPVYDYDAVLAALKDGDGKVMVHQWLNGMRPELITSDTPESFQNRVRHFVMNLLQLNPNLLRSNFILTTHYEIVLLVKTLFVDRKNSVTEGIDETWEPTKNGGIIIWNDSGSYGTREFTPDLRLV